MAEYIEREMALKAINEYLHTTNPDGEEQIGVLKSRKVIRALPAADVATVRHGKWRYYHKQNIAVCEKCNFERNLDVNFGRAVSCPNCGAMMDLKEG